MAKRTETVKYWRPKAKAAFQKYIRIRDSDKHGICRCITCGRAVRWKACDGGHYRSARFNATCFDEKNVYAQCKGCNKNRMDRIETLEVYIQRIDEKHGKGTAERLKVKSLISCKMSWIDYKKIFEEYTEKGKKLARIKGLDYGR